MLTGARLDSPFSAEAGRALITRLARGMFPPGAGTRYNNGNFRIVQWVLEAVTGQSLSSLMQARIWGPLGMRDSRLGEDTSQPLDGTRGYRAAIAREQRGGKKRSRASSGPATLAW
jgi:CubicO group peptidase (beta-lactamase class C family)